LISLPRGKQRAVRRELRLVSRVSLRAAEPADEVRALGIGRRAIAEGVGTAFLLAVVVGSGVMGERLSHGDAAVTLLANSLASGAGLTALILAFGRVYGAHLNPLVTVAEAFHGGVPWADVPPYVLAQVCGAIVGVVIAHLMFADRVFTLSRHGRAGVAQIFSELVATFGLIVVIRGAARFGAPAVALGVGCYILAAYWFTSSTSFANPAVTIARALTDTFVGIRPRDVPGFLVGQAAGALIAMGFLRIVDEKRRS
jgi:glycerol uptake facilitator-like aquaporin